MPGVISGSGFFFVLGDLRLRDLVDFLNFRTRSSKASNGE